MLPIKAAASGAARMVFEEVIQRLCDCLFGILLYPLVPAQVC